jgi:hypothetical protein
VSYATLTTRFPLWCKRSDALALLPDFVALAEAKFNRLLRVRAMYQPITGTIDSNSEIALPAGFLAIKSLWPTATPQGLLTEQALETVMATPRNGAMPTNYAVLNTALRFNGGGDVTGVYYQSIPSLQTASNNWLDTLAPDLYLYAVLAEAYIYFEDPKISAFVGQRDLILQEIIDNDMRDRFSGPLQATKR